MPDDDLHIPNSSKGDVVHALTKAGLGSIPIVGAAAAELFQYVIQSPLEKRRDSWMAEIGQKLYELEARGFQLESLQDNEEFVSTVMHASTLALRTHQKEKLAALKNAVINVATGFSPDETLQEFFLTLVDSLTVLHLKILAAFTNPVAPPDMHTGDLIDVLQHNVTELRDRRELSQQLWLDLYYRGLLKTRAMLQTLSGRSLSEKYTTDIADEFLQFISSPEQAR